MAQLSDEQLREMLEVCEKVLTLVPERWYHTQGGSVFAPAHRVSTEGARVLAYVDVERTETNAVFDHVARFDPPTCAALVREVIRLRDLTTPKPLPKAGECVGRFGSNSDECTKCGLSEKDHK